MSKRLSRKSFVLLAVMMAGTIFQTSCATTIATSIGELGSSITGQYIRNLVNELMGISTGFSF